MIEMKMKFQSNAIKRLEAMQTRAKSMAGFYNTVIYRIYQDAQRMRWVTENASEGDRWKPLSPLYAKYKLKRYGGGPKYQWIGGQGNGRPWKLNGTWPDYGSPGNKTLYATGRLLASAIGNRFNINPVDNGGKKSKTFDHRKVATDASLTVYSITDYGKDVAKRRPFMRFGKHTLDRMHTAVRDFLVWGKQ